MGRGFQAEEAARAKAWGGWGRRCAVSGLGRGVGRDSAWQMADQGCLGSLPPPLLLATCPLGPSNPISCSLAAPGGHCPAVIPICRRRLLRLEIECL